MKRTLLLTVPLLLGSPVFAACPGNPATSCGPLPECPIDTNAGPAPTASLNKAEVSMVQCCEPKPGDMSSADWAIFFGIHVSSYNDIDKALFQHYEYDEECKCILVANDEYSDVPGGGMGQVIWHGSVNPQVPGTYTLTAEIHNDASGCVQTVDDPIFRSATVTITPRVPNPIQATFPSSTPVYNVSIDMSTKATDCPPQGVDCYPEVCEYIVYNGGYDWAYGYERLGGTSQSDCGALAGSSSSQEVTITVSGALSVPLGALNVSLGLSGSQTTGKAYMGSCQKPCYSARHALYQKVVQVAGNYNRRFRSCVDDSLLGITSHQIDVIVKLDDHINRCSYSIAESENPPLPPPMPEFAGGLP